MSDMVQSPIPLIEQLRAWFHPKDRSVQLAADCWAMMNAGTVQISDLSRQVLSVVGIGETVLTAPAASVTFASLPQNFRSLLFTTQVRTDKVATNDIVLWRANADAGANYDYVNAFGIAGAAGSGNAIAATSGFFAYCDAANSRAACFGGSLAIFPNYRSNTMEKQSWNIGGNVGVPTAGTIVCIFDNSHWRSTAAITQIDLFPSTGPNFVAGSVFQLYGIL